MEWINASAGLCKICVDHAVSVMTAPYLTIAQASKLLNVNPNTIRVRLEKNKFPNAYKETHGGRTARIRIPESDIACFGKSLSAHYVPAKVCHDGYYPKSDLPETVDVESDPSWLTFEQVATMINCKARSVRELSKPFNGTSPSLQTEFPNARKTPRYGRIYIPTYDIECFLARKFYGLQRPLWSH